MSREPLIGTDRRPRYRGLLCGLDGCQLPRGHRHACGRMLFGSLRNGLGWIDRERGCGLERDGWSIEDEARAWIVDLLADKRLGASWIELEIYDVTGRTLCRYARACHDTRTQGGG